MAFGDIIQQASGDVGTAVTLPTAVTEGNSLVLVASFRSGEGGLPATVSDNINAANYESVVVADPSATTFGDSSVWLLSGSAAGTPTVSFAGTTQWRWALFEVEGALETDVSGSGLNYTASSTLTTTSATVVAGSVAFGMAQLDFASRDLTPTVSGWTRSPETTAEFFTRTNATSESIGLSGSIGGGTSAYTAAWASFSEVDPNAPTLADINTNNEVVPGTTATITGTNLTNATGFNVGSASQSAFTVASATNASFTVVRGGNPYNQNLTGTLLHPDGNATITVQQIPEIGTFAVTAASPNTTDDASLWTGLIDTATSDPITIVNGDQAWVKNPNNLTNLAIQPDGTITADQTGDFVVQIWLASEGVWGSDQTVSFNLDGVDTTPDPFTVAPLNDQPLNQWVEFAPIEVLGIDPGEEIAAAVTNAEYAVDAGAGYGAFTAISTNVQAGYFVKPRILTLNDFETESTGSISIGSQSSGLSATTRAAVLPVLTAPMPDINATEGDPVSLDMDNYVSGATSYDAAGLPSGSGLSLTGSVLSGTTNTNDTAASPFSLTITAHSADGSIQDVVDVVVDSSTGVSMALISGVTGTVTDNVMVIIEGENLLLVEAVVITDPATGESVEQQIIDHEVDQICIIVNQGDLPAGTDVSLELVVSGQENPTMTMEIWRDENFNATPDRPLLPVTWDYGSRHPKTNRRVRQYKGRV